MRRVGGNARDGDEWGNYRKRLCISLNVEEHSDCQWLYFILTLIFFVDFFPPSSYVTCVRKLHSGYCSAFYRRTRSAQNFGSRVPGSDSASSFYLTVK